MQLDLRGKIREKKLAYNHTLLPLYEAIVNSIHAIEERGNQETGMINIKLIRSNQTEIDDELPPIISFEISDNGIGFNEANYESFNYAHSTYKETKGGKGVGRLVWLKAFELAEINSVFKENGHYINRKFKFKPTKKGIEGLEDKKINEPSSVGSTVKLINLKEDYRRWCNQNPEHIALKILEHCFPYFLDENTPRISIIDGGSKLVVNDYFQKYLKENMISHKININSLEFDLNITKDYSRKDSLIHYCADKREVFNEKLSNEIPELDRKLEDGDGQSFSLNAYISGAFLDQRTNDERTVISFEKPSDNPTLYSDAITQEELRSLVAEKIREDYSSYLEQSATERRIRINAFLADNPRYRYLNKYRSEEVSKLPSNLSDERLEIELFKIQQKLDLEVKQEAKVALKKVDSIQDRIDFRENFKNLYQKVMDVGNSRLSEYVINRKLVLDILEKSLDLENDKYSKEDAVHGLIFPLKTASDDIGFDDHNLWVIDERLAFHNYLASDLSLKKNQVSASESLDRPDLLIFNKPFAFAEDNKPYSSIVIVEFKRPMRDDYDENENPINQITKYVRQLRETGAKDKKGRLIDLKEGTPIYAYIICDLTSKLRVFAEDQGYKKMPDNNGYFSFNPNYDLYCEIISFDKLVKDSKQRNKALFESLNLPSQ